MNSLVLAPVLLVVGGGLAALAGRRERLSVVFALTGLIAGALVGLIPALRVLGGAPALSLRAAWNLPMASFSLGLDGLSAIFEVPILLLAVLAGIYGASYVAPWRGRKNLGAYRFFYNLLVASMCLVVTARNGMLFLLAWEVMALASYFLVVFEDDSDTIRQAGRTYLIATHLGTAALLVLFLILGTPGTPLDFERFGAGLGARTAAAAFFLALIGFGTKAGFMPFHIWLPEAHPASPSPVSALMSGVMIKTGIYGLLRTLTFLGAPPPLWGWTLLGLGALTATLGVLFALAQRDLKRLLAYSSVENIGIVAIGLGLGLLGWSAGLPAMAFLGFTAALLHVVNHAHFKGLLFLGAGAVVHATHTRDLEAMGGLLKRMPQTGLFFLFGAAAICGLPPLNGFVGEFVALFAGIHGLLAPGSVGPAAGAIALLALALTGGLAAACFTKAFGIAFLGEPRSAPAASAHEVAAPMRGVMAVLAAACLALGLFGSYVASVAGRVVSTTLLPGGAQLESFGLAAIVFPLRMVTLVGTLLLVLAALVAWLRHGLLSGRRVEAAPTWDCGYAAPAASMQYTGSGFVQPLTELFRVALRTRRQIRPPSGLFPPEASLATQTPDPAHLELYIPAFSWLGRLLAKARWVQQGRLQFYVLYVAVTLLAVLVWKLGWP